MRRSSGRQGSRTWSGCCNGAATSSLTLIPYPDPNSFALNNSPNPNANPNTLPPTRYHNVKSELESQQHTERIRSSKV